MPSAISHIIAGSSLGYALNGRKKDALFWFLAAAISIFPDMDVLAFMFGIPYEHVLGHRGFFHSLSFAVMVSPIGVREFFSGWGLRVIKSELFYIIVPTCLITVIIFMMRSAFRRNAQD